MRMSSGASAAYEKPRSGRSSCIDETPRSSRIASARTPFAASSSSDGRELAVEQPHLGRRRRGGAARSTARRSGRGRSRSACPRRAAARRAARSGRPRRRCSRSPSRPGCGASAGEHLVRENGNVISLGWQDARQHLLRSLRLRAAARASRRDPRSRGGRRRRRR